MSRARLPLPSARPAAARLRLAHRRRAPLGTDPPVPLLCDPRWSPPSRRHLYLSTGSHTSGAQSGLPMPCARHSQMATPPSCSSGRAEAQRPTRRQAGRTSWSSATASHPPSTRVAQAWASGAAATWPAAPGGTSACRATPSSDVTDTLGATTTGDPGPARPAGRLPVDDWFLAQIFAARRLRSPPRGGAPTETASGAGVGSDRRGLRSLRRPAPAVR